MMKNLSINVIIIGLLSLIFNAYFSQPSFSIELTPKNDQAVATAPTNIDFSKHFKAFNVEGSIFIYDQQNAQTFQYNLTRNQTAFPAASTFKIPNSLIALETGVIKDELALLTWDGIQRALPQWNRDLNLREAFKLSTVWFYQVLARRIGYKQMQKWITTIGYGNQNIGTRTDIDQFWLNGELKITPAEQVTFLRRLYANELPFSERTLTAVKDIMIVEKTPNYTIRAKTGWFGFGDHTVQNIGWYVGYVEKNEKAYFFATNIDIKTEQDAIARIEISRLCLEDLGIIKQ